ncbi:unnamed protein product, partial [Coregonus sp. 'balchen']
TVLSVLSSHTFLNMLRLVVRDESELWMSESMVWSCGADDDNYDDDDEEEEDKQQEEEGLPRLSPLLSHFPPSRPPSICTGTFFLPLTPSHAMGIVDLGFLRFVSAIGTQGAVSQETKKTYWVKSYKVDVSSNGEDWITLKEGSKQKVFQGNTNPTDVARTMLPKPTLTRFIRIRPVAWETGIALRFEVYGCKISEYPCSGMLGMVSGLITDAQITASSHTDRSWVPENARLLTSRSGWTLLPQPQPFTSEWLQVKSTILIYYSYEYILPLRTKNLAKMMMRLQINSWETLYLRHTGIMHYDAVMSMYELLTMRFLSIHLQVDLGEEKLVRGLIIQGGKHRENKVFMKKFRLGYSNNGSDWKMVQDANGNKPKVRKNSPTLPPTTPAPTTTPSDDCDDDQASCHSGTGDDYDVGTTMPEAMTEVDTIPVCGLTLTPDTLQNLEYLYVSLCNTVTCDLSPCSAAFLWFACDFGWANDPSFCSWTSEDSSFRWQIQSSGTPTLNTGPNMDHTGGSGNFIYTLATGAQETEVARLVSPVVTVGQSDLCVSFWYHMFGSHIGTLHIKQRKETVDGMADILLWTVSGHQGNRWREGRVLVPHSSKPYQVVIEGLVERKSWGDIAVDDIKILDNLNMADCKDPDVPTESMLPEDRFNEIMVDITDFPEIVESNEILNGVSGGAGNMLKTLDPILITIIAMSALGVFLGAICGVVLYCACSHGHMSDRNLSALENYNFELVDGVKLKKDKLNSQNSYTEA